MATPKKAKHSRHEAHRSVGSGTEGRYGHQGRGDEAQRGRPQPAPPTGATFKAEPMLECKT